jgi:tight adherence protein B
MMAVVALTFLVVLGALMLSISSGLRFFEGQRRRQLVSVLKTVTEAEEPHVDLLIDPEERRKDSDRLPGPKAFYENLNRLMAESGLDWNMSRLIMMSSGGFVVGAVLGTLIPFESPAFLRALIGGVCIAWLPLMHVRRTRTKRLEEMEGQLPDALDFLARSMRAGHAFTISLEMVGEEIHDPLGQEFRGLFNEQNLGASLDRSLANFGKRVPLPDVRFFSSAVLLQRQTGGNLGEVLSRLSHIIRERFRLKGQVKATSAHGRLTATILTVLPLATLGGLMLTSPGYLSPLIRDPAGRQLVIAGVVCQVLGNYFIRRIVRIRV